MPKIDKFIEMMVQRQVEKAVLSGDRPFQLFAHGQASDGSIISTAQVQQVLEEITPQYLLPQLSQGGTFGFHYSSLYGEFDISVQAFFGSLQVTITPATGVPSRLEPLTPGVGASSSAQPGPLVGYAPQPLAQEPQEAGFLQQVPSYTPQPLAQQAYTPPLSVTPGAVQVPGQNQNASQPVYCQSCGAGNTPGASFCYHCGKPMNAASGQPPAVQGGYPTQNIINVTTTVAPPAQPQYVPVPQYVPIPQYIQRPYAEIKNPGLAAILSLFFPGAGQIYNGQVGIGILAFFFTLLLYPVVLGFFLHVWLVYEAYSTAQRINRQGM